MKIQTEKSLKEKIILIRREIHKYPELGNQEFRTTKLIEETLKQHKIRTFRITKTGIVAVLKGRKNKRNKCIALRADIDALPIQEKTNKKYASKTPGIMHACGHDANTSIVMGSAILLSRQTDKFSGSVKFIFQPNEETAGGANQMLSKGVLKNPKVDAIIGIHVNPWLACGTLGLKSDEMMAAVDKFTIEIIGEGSHGAYPHLGKDAILVASKIISSLQDIVAREIDPVDPAVITVGTINGGEAFNILPRSVIITGTVRTLNERLHKIISKLIEKKVFYITKAYGASYKFNYEVLGYPLKNSKSILEICRSVGIDLLGTSRVKIIEKPSMGGEDFSEYLRYVPGCFIFWGTGLKKPYPWHSDKFDINESSLYEGSYTLSEVAKRYLE